mmetsp:Transcript_129163/g.401745  ORF Transcript_129163/g.401745 Transcript_129163/m.401745 type:complete len:458 (+) Transcript_129163:57-1430(+)
MLGMLASAAASMLEDVESVASGHGREARSEGHGTGRGGPVNRGLLDLHASRRLEVGAELQLGLGQGHARRIAGQRSVVGALHVVDLAVGTRRPDGSVSSDARAAPVDRPAGLVELGPVGGAALEEEVGRGHGPVEPRRLVAPLQIPSLGVEGHDAAVQLWLAQPGARGDHHREACDPLVLVQGGHRRMCVARVRQDLLPKQRPVVQRVGPQDALLAFCAPGSARVAASVDDIVRAEGRAALGERAVVSAWPRLPESRPVSHVHSVNLAGEVHQNHGAITGEEGSKVHKRIVPPEGPRQLTRCSLQRPRELRATGPPGVLAVPGPKHPLVVVPRRGERLPGALAGVAPGEDDVARLDVKRHDPAVRVAREDDAPHEGRLVDEGPVGLVVPQDLAVRGELAQAVARGHEEVLLHVDHRPARDDRLEEVLRRLPCPREVARQVCRRRVLESTGAGSGPAR